MFIRQFCGTECLELRSLMKRVKRHIRASPNPLFESWLKEWREEARKNGSEMQYCFGKALKSLQKFPFKLETGKECLILEHFGAKICKMLDKRLNEYNESKQENSIDLKNVNHIKRNLKDKHNLDPNIVLNEVINKRKSCMDSPARTPKYLRDESDNLNQNEKNLAYLPTYRSGGYAILLALHKSSKPMTKAELEMEAQEFCDAPFKKTDSYYTAWSSMSTLIKKKLVEKYGKPVRFNLTSKGIDVALHLQSIYENKDPCTNNDLSLSKNCIKLNQYSGEECTNFDLSITFNVGGNDNQISNMCSSKTNKETVAYNNSKNNDVTLKSDENIVKHTEIFTENDNQNNDTSKRNEESIFFLPNNFDFILYVDTQEMENNQNFENDKTVRYLRKKNVKFEVKHLNIGDYLWICRDSKTKTELVLPYIVERKRIDDLAMSIKDGRFHEQKFRLKQCGLQNLIYLVEKCGNDSHRLGLPLPTIQQAISNTAILDDFYIKITDDHDDSMSYLCGMTSFLTKIFKDKILMSCRKNEMTPINLSSDIISLMMFPEFNKDSGKMRKFNVRNMFMKHLLQLNGLSVEKAKAIVKIYPTPKSFFEALQKPKGEAVIADITYGSLNRCIGSALAKSIHRLYTLKELN